MTNNSPNEYIVNFVRNTLGCYCGDDVFNSIRLESGNTPCGEVKFTKAVIGNRLLIYIVKNILDVPIDGVIPVLANMGRSERDLNGYNRFRLALTYRSDAEQHTALNIFNNSIGYDEKSHIHFVSIEEVHNIDKTA